MNTLNLAINPIVPEWLSRQGSRSVSLTWLRVSTGSRDAAASNADAARSLSYRQGLRLVESSGGAGLMLDPTNRQLRDEVGALPLLRRHASPFADSPGREIGMLIPIEANRELLLIVHDSMTEENVHLPGDHVGQNAVTEFLIQWLLLPQVGELHVARLDRLTRATHHGMRLQTVMRSQGISVFEGGQPLDFTSEGGALMSAMRTGLSSSERDKTVTRSVVGQMGAVQAGRWPQKGQVICPGYRVHPDTRKKNLVIADDEHAHGWTEIFRAAARGDSWVSIGRLLALHRLPVRHLNYDRKSDVYSDLDDKSATSAAQSAVQMSHVRVLRSRSYSRTWEVAVQVEADRKEWEGYPVDEVRMGHPVVTVTCEWPEHGINLSEDEWDAVERRLTTRQPRERARDEYRFALTPGPAGVWTHRGWEYRITTVSAPETKTGKYGYYKVWRRKPQEDGRGWLGREGEIVATVRTDEADRRLGQALEEALLNHAERGVLPPASLTVPQRSNANLTAASRLAETEIELADAQDDLADARIALEAGDSERRRAKVSHAEGRVATLEGEIAALTEQIDGHRIPQAVDLDLSTLAALAGALQGTKGRTMPRVLNDHVRRTLQGSLRFYVSPRNDREVIMSAHWAWPTIGGETVTISTTLIMRNASQSRLSTASGEGIAKAVLRDSIPLPQAMELVTGFGHRDMVNRFPGRWMRKRGVGPFDAALSRQQRDNYARLARAALDCPIEETRRIIWWVLTGDGFPEGGDPGFVAHVRDVYTVRGFRAQGEWWSGDVGKERRLLRLFEDAAARGIDIAAGADRKRISELAGVKADDITRRVEGYAGPMKGNPIAVLEPIPGNRRALRPRMCPDCGEFMMHVLDVPEVHDAVCRRCQRAPGGPLLPEEYALLWDADQTFEGDGMYVGSRVADVAEYRASRLGLQRRLVGGLEAARIAGVKPCTLYRWAKLGAIQVFSDELTDRMRFDPAEMAELNDPGNARFHLMRRSEDGTALMLIPEAARMLGVRERPLRALALSTEAALGPLPYQEAPYGNGLQKTTIAVRPEDLNAIEKRWVRKNASD